MRTTLLNLSTARQGLPWWEWRSASRRLEVWLKAILGGASYHVAFDETFRSPGGHDPEGRRIVLNPAAWTADHLLRWHRALEVELVTPWLGEIHDLATLQWLCCKAVAAHEAGHARFSGSPAKENLLARVQNMLEDERVELGMARLYPALRGYFALAGDVSWLALDPTDPSDDSPYPVLHGLVLHRWEQRRPAEASKIRLSPSNQERWTRVRPLVEAAWQAPTPDAVLSAARKILEILGLPEEIPQPEIPDWLRRLLELLADVLQEPRRASDGEAERLPPGSEEGDRSPAHRGPAAEAPEDCLDSDRNPAEPFVSPAPYGYLEDAARPHVARLVAALQLPQPDQGPGYGRQGRRLSTRRALRDLPDPFRARGDVGDAPPEMVVDILADRSGSMGQTDYGPEPERLAMQTDWRLKISAARLGIMTLHLALEELRMPHALHLFDDHVPIKPHYDRSGEMVKALIAGWQGVTGEEWVSLSMSRRIPELLARPEPLKVLLVLHDGHPVGVGGEFGTDVNGIRILQGKHKRQIWIIGVYLGSNAGEIGRMRGLFEHLIACEPSRFAEHLGRLLRHLWTGRRAVWVP